MRNKRTRTTIQLPALAALSLFITSALAQTPPMAVDIPTSFTAPVNQADYVKKVVMVPMRDGVKLYTVIIMPKSMAAKAPIMLTRTPYNAARRAQRNISPSIRAILPQGDETFIDEGYIRVFQDVRGKYGSE
eukprot:gene25921-26090_t